MCGVVIIHIAGAIEEIEKRLYEVRTNPSDPGIRSGNSKTELKSVRITYYSQFGQQQAAKRMYANVEC
jgi:hypothetical protein